MNEPLTRYEYACQKKYPLRWQIVGLGPTDLDTARQDFLDWSGDESFSEFRLVRRAPSTPGEAAPHESPRFSVGRLT